jgi:hypothetical protein
MNKYALLFFVLFVVAVSFFFFHPLHTTQKKTASNNKPKYLCDTAVADCSKSNSGVPKGVCIPGGKCT